MAQRKKRLVGRLLVEKLHDLLRDSDVCPGRYVIHPLGKRLELVLLEHARDRGTGSGRAVEMVTASADSREIAGLFSEDFRKSDLVTMQRRGKPGDPRGYR